MTQFWQTRANSIRRPSSQTKSLPSSPEQLPRSAIQAFIQGPLRQATSLPWATEIFWKHASETPFKFHGDPDNMPPSYYRCAPSIAIGLSLYELKADLANLFYAHIVASIARAIVEQCSFIHKATPTMCKLCNDQRRDAHPYQTWALVLEYDDQGGSQSCFVPLVTLCGPIPRWDNFWSQPAHLGWMSDCWDAEDVQSVREGIGRLHTLCVVDARVTESANVSNSKSNDVHFVCTGTDIFNQQRLVGLD